MALLTIEVSGSEKIAVRARGGSSRLESSLKRSKRNRRYNAAVDAVESLAVSLGNAGVNLNAPHIQEAFATTIDAIADTYGDR